MPYLQFQPYRANGKALNWKLLWKVRISMDLVVHPYHLSCFLSTKIRLKLQEKTFEIYENPIYLFCRSHYCGADCLRGWIVFVIGSLRSHFPDMVFLGMARYRFNKSQAIPQVRLKHFNKMLVEPNNDNNRASSNTNKPDRNIQQHIQSQADTLSAAIASMDARIESG